MNNKNSILFSFFEWIIVVTMMSIFALQFVGLPENNDQYYALHLNYLAEKPAIYRVLVPALSNALVSFGMRGDWAMATINFFSGLGAFAFIKLLSSRYNVGKWAGLCFMLTYTLLLNHASASDWMTVLLFCMSFFFLSTERFGWYLVTFPLVALHRETSILLILLFFVYIARKATARTLSFWFFQIAMYCIIRGLIMSHFANAPGQPLYFFTYNVIPVYLSTPAMLSALFVLIGFFMVVKARWEVYDSFLRSSLVLIPIQIILHLVLGNPFEFRVLAESFPVAVLMMIIPLLYFYTPKGFSPSTNIGRNL